MHRIVFAAALCALLALPTLANAQSVRDYPTTPDLSPSASVSQTVGITDISVTYSSPAVRERTIWGELVPYGEVWRAGANAPTKFMSSTDFTFGGTEVPAGTYTLLVLPEDGEWQVMLNTDSAGRGAYSYNADENVAITTVTPVDGAERERMLFIFHDTTDTGTTLALEWAGLVAPIEIGVPTATLVEENIAAAASSLWRPHFNAARYYLNAGDAATAEPLMAQSIAIEGTWWNHWFMAEIHAELGSYATAREHAAQAMVLGEGDDTWNNFFLPDAEEALETWPES